MSTVRKGDCLRGEVTVSFNGVSHTRTFVLGPELGKIYGHYEVKDWPISPNGTRMLRGDQGGMREECGYMVSKTAEECLRHVLYALTGRY